MTPTEWERAYLRFETPRQEGRKFRERFRWLGVDRLPRHSVVLDLFCGRGSGETALRQMGFSHIIGIDLSEALMRTRTSGPDGVVADCRFLPVADQSVDIAIVQGGLHHLPTLMDDLHLVLGEIHRVTRTPGRFFLVEPWDTMFLRAVHRISESPLRYLSRKLDAFQEMTRYERVTYEQWLGKPYEIYCALGHYFLAHQLRNRWGKIYFEGSPLPPEMREPQWPLGRHEQVV